MKKDWVVWGGCVLLFGAGAVWASISTKQKFFEVASIHDFFEILSSAATVIAVFVAALSVNAWRKQINGQADHALAQRVAVAALRYKEAARVAWTDAVFCLNAERHGLHGYIPELLEKVTGGMQVKLSANQAEKADFLAVLQESRAIWGRPFSSNYDELLNFAECCYGVVRLFSVVADEAVEDGPKQRAKIQLEKERLKLEAQGWHLHTASIMDKVDTLTTAADEHLELKLLRR